MGGLNTQRRQNSEQLGRGGWACSWREEGSSREDATTLAPTQICLPPKDNSGIGAHDPSPHRRDTHTSREPGDSSRDGTRDSAPLLQQCLWPQGTEQRQRQRPRPRSPLLQWHPGPQHPQNRLWRLETQQPWRKPEACDPGSLSQSRRPTDTSSNTCGSKVPEPPGHRAGAGQKWCRRKVRLAISQAAPKVNQDLVLWRHPLGSGRKASSYQPQPRIKVNKACLAWMRKLSGTPNARAKGQLTSIVKTHGNRVSRKENDHSPDTKLKVTDDCDLIENLK